MVKFVSYDGSYPNLCSGTLVVEINGKEVSFGYHDADYRDFWCSGGRVWFDENWEEQIEKGNWVFFKGDFPEEYMEYYDEICDLFDENVPQGCCGGCV